MAGVALWARRLLWVVGVLFGVLLALVALALVAADSSPGRGYICDEVEAAASSALTGNIILGRCEALTLWHLRIEDVTITGAQGEPLISIDAVDLHTDLHALVQGELRVKEVVVSGPSVSLAQDSNGQLALVDAFRPVPDPDAEPEPADPEEEPLAVFVDSVRIEGGQVSDLPDTLMVRELDLAASVAYENEQLFVDVGHIGATVDRGEVSEAARLESLSGQVALAPSQRSLVTAHLVSGTDSIHARAGMLWGEDGPARFEAALTLALSPETLERFGQTQAAQALKTSVRGTVHAEGSLTEIDATASLFTDGGPLQLTASLEGGSARTTVATPSLELSEVASAAPAGRLAVELSASMEHVLGGADHRPFRARVQGLQYRDYVLPALILQGELDDAEVRVTSLELPHLTGSDGRLQVHGRAGFDGSAEVDLDARLPAIDRDSNVRRLAPNVDADITALLRASLSAGDDPQLDARGRIVIAQAKAPGLCLERAEVSGFARGALTAPTLSVDALVTDVRASGQHVTKATLSARGGPSRYKIGGQVSLVPGRRAELDLDVVARSGTFRVDGGVTAHGLWQGPVRLSAHDVVIDPSQHVRIGAVDARGLRLAAHVTGTYRFSGSSSIHATLSELDLALADRVFQLDRGVEGRATAEVHFSGTPPRPDLDARVEVTQGRAEAVPIPRAVVAGRLLTSEREVALQADVELGDFGDISASVEGTLARRRGLGEAAFRDGDWVATVEARQVSTAIAQLFSAEVPELQGSVDTRLHVEGTLDDPTITFTASGAGLATAQIDPLAARIESSLASDQLRVDVRVDDIEGDPLATMLATATLDLEALVRSGDPMAIAQEPWSLTLAVPSRPRERLPVALPSSLDGLESLEAGFELRGGSGPIEADAAVATQWSFGNEAPTATCRGGPVPPLHATLALREGQTDLRIWAELPDQEVAEATAQIATPVDEWVRSGFDSLLADLAVAAQVQMDIPFEAVPRLCERSSGQLTAQLTATELLGAEPRVELRSEITELHFDGSEPMGAVVAATVAPGLAQAEGHLRTRDREAVFFEAAVPLLWGGEVMVPALAGDSWSGRVRFDQAPLAPLLAPAPGVSQPSGQLDGEITARGQGTEVALAGQVAFESLGLTIHEPFQRIDNLDGRVRLERNRIVLEGLELRDTDGQLSMSAQVGLAQWTPTTIQARVQARRFPLRNEGVIFARADSVLQIDADLAARPRTARIVVLETNIALPDESGRLVQTLDQHPDVIYEDQPGFDPSDGEDDAHAEVAEAGDQPPQEPPVPMVITVDATAPFWVRHTDFAMQLTADLRVETEGGAPRVSGPLRVMRGFLALLGTTFELQPGELIFAGGRSIDPVLDLTAVHTFRSDETVTVAITGRLSSPELTFSTTVPGVETEREILALLVTGRSGDDAAATAEEQAISMLASVTAGLLTSLARRRLGGVIPILSIESHGAQETRARAGIQADRLIPLWMRRVIRGVYIEGYVGTRPDEDGGGPGVTGGAAVELYLPHDLVTTGTWEEPDNWSLDLTWEP